MSVGPRAGGWPEMPDYTSKPPRAGPGIGADTWSGMAYPGCSEYDIPVRWQVIWRSPNRCHRHDRSQAAAWRASERRDRPMARSATQRGWPGRGGRDWLLASYGLIFERLAKAA